MESPNWNLYRYRLLFKHPLSMLGRMIRDRRGLILQIKDDDGVSGEGEIAPLEGVHLESLDQAEEQVRCFLDGRKTDFKLYPSVRFGVEMAWNLFNSNRQGNDSRYLNSLSSLPVNALITGDETDMCGVVQRIREGGFQAVKIKAGEQSVEKDIERVHRLRSYLSTSTALRIDANRRWSLEQAEKFAEGVRGAEIDYCEEPLANMDQLKNFYQISGMPLALDESLWESGGQEVIPWSSIKTLVLKPGRLGGWDSCQRWVSMAKQHQVGVTFSSCLESGLGLSWIALMNLEMVSPPSPAGLDTFEAFSQDLAEPPFGLEKGFFHIPEQWPRFEMKSSKLIASGRIQRFLGETELHIP